MQPEVTEQALGRWPYIHAALGIDNRFLRNRHMPCPGCNGTDRFRYDDKDGRGTFFCGGGGDPIHGDGFVLLHHVHGWDFKAAANEVRQVLGIAPNTQTARATRIPQAPKPSVNEVPKTQAYALSLWAAANTDEKHVAAHGYCQKKSITWAAGAGRGRASGRLIGRDADVLIVPMRTLRGDMTGVECVNPQGVKQTFGNKGILVLGNTLDKSLPVYITEGWADAVSAKMLFGNVVSIAVFGKGQQDKVADEILASRPNRDIKIMRDADA